MGKSFQSAVLVVFFAGVSIWAQEGKPSASSPPGATTQANSGLQREYARLAQLLNSNDTFGKQEAAETLLRVRPSDIANVETRKLIARGYRSLAMEGRGHHQGEAIRGLVIWGANTACPS